jgi:2,3,4,5-tetrahydropyridine-2-carboxylate N-succinyltransferase
MSSFTLLDLERGISELARLSASATVPPHTDLLIASLLDALEVGSVRAAFRDVDGRWRPVPWVKQGILLAFRAGKLVDMTPRLRGTFEWQVMPFNFVEKHTLPPRQVLPSDGVRVVPGGTSIRRGAYLGKGVVVMPPAFVNVGAWVGPDTMLDSHVLVGSCAQIGARVHISAGAQIGGVLEPVNAAPVVIEDDVIVGGNCGVYEGTVVRERAVLAAGVILTRGTRIYDLVRETVYSADASRPLEVPAGAVVVPGARAASGRWAIEHGIAIQTPVIVKYRDERTDAATALEEALR